MAKRMQDKESIAGVSWLIVLALSCWGGLVRYLIDVKQNKATWSWINAALADGTEPTRQTISRPETGWRHWEHHDRRAAQLPSRTG